MKKYFLFFIVVILAVGLSGCLNDNGNDTNLTDNDSKNNSNNASNESDPANKSDAVVFDSNLTLVQPVPEGFKFISTASVKSHGQHVGITDALFGYQGIYNYGENNVPVFLTYYDVAIANTTKTPESYIQMMKDSHLKQYGNDSNISIIQINGHDVTLFAATTEETPQYGRYILAWSLNDTILVTVAGNAELDVLKTLAVASGH